jgi:tyrosyl-tRNA synthetase
MAPIKAAYDASPEWQEIAAKAYPVEGEKKKVKKVKNKGTRYPGPVADGTLPVRAKETEE